MAEVGGVRRQVASTTGDAVMHGDVSQSVIEIQMANAHLLASAPELLAALQRSLNWCTAAGMDGSGDCIEPEWCSQARAAISKARGGK
jgi:hypothetical protein